MRIGCLILPLLVVNNRTKGHLALLGANIFYGAGFTVAKEVMPRLIAPLGFIFIRVAIVMVLFWLSFFWGKKYRAKIAKNGLGCISIGWFVWCCT